MAVATAADLFHTEQFHVKGGDFLRVFSSHRDVFDLWHNSSSIESPRAAVYNNGTNSYLMQPDCSQPESRRQHLSSDRVIEMAILLQRSCEAARKVIKATKISET